MQVGAREAAGAGRARAVLRQRSRVAREHRSVDGEPPAVGGVGDQRRAVAGVKRALPNARVGGPATTGPADVKAAAFLKAFLSHCAEGKNYATGGRGAPLDFISYHAKGSPQAMDGHVRMGIARNLQDVDEGLKIISSYAKFRELPVILSESDPEGCAACSARIYPQTIRREAICTYDEGFFCLPLSCWD